MKKRLIVFALITCFMSSLVTPSLLAVDKNELDKALSRAADYIAASVTRPTVSVISGEWAVIGLVRSGRGADPEFFERYYLAVGKRIEDTRGKLHESKYTEYSRVILGLSAAGYDPRDVIGYDLTLYLGDFERTVSQGINGPIWALIALDSAGYPIPKNPDARTQATRGMYIDEILKRQLNDGGWNLSEGDMAAGAQASGAERGDPGITGMALQALAKYQDSPEVRASISKALAYLSDVQKADGGFAASGDPDAESVAQVLIGLCELGVDLDDARFVKNGSSVLTKLLSYQNSNGSFRHTSSGAGSVNQMSSEQGLCALAAAYRAAAGVNSLYRMSDATKRAVAVAGAKAGDSGAKTGSSGAVSIIGLPGKHKDIKKAEIIFPGKTFTDVTAHKSRSSIDALAARGIIGGRGAGRFDPDATITRAEYASLITRALTLPERRGAAGFTDVPPSAWYAAPVGTAFYYNIVSGVSATSFKPEAAITRQEAAAMTARAAKLAGADTSMSESAIRDTLSLFDDYLEASDWARGILAYCVAEEILEIPEMSLRPLEVVTRAQVAEMIYNMLDRVNLL